MPATPEQFAAAAQQLAEAKKAATGDAQATALDQAWAAMFTAGRHALLAQRFAKEAAAARNWAMQLGTRPGRGIAAEQARVRAAALARIAERHREAAEGAQASAETLAAAARETGARPATSRRHE